jgi:C-terminal processing protease CtpA/Prc
MLSYVYRSLSPRAGMHLVVEHPTGIPQEMDVIAKIVDGRAVRDYTDETDRHFMGDEGEKEAYRLRHRYHSYGDSVLVWRFPEFLAGGEDGIDNMMAIAKRHRALVLDLRGNGGGAVTTQERLIASFFDTAFVVDTMKMRSGVEVHRVTPTSKDPFRGMTVVLVDAGSGSSSEIVARALQLQGRAIVVGDRSAGAVQMARWFPHGAGGSERFLEYGASITIADVVMFDGSRLERIGVVPDEIVLPTGADMAAKRDPQMARALALVGMTVTPEQAARVFHEDKDAEE